MFRFILLFIVASFAAFAAFAATPSVKVNDTQAEFEQQDFEVFLAEIYSQAVAQGVSKSTLDKAFSGLKPDPKVIGYDRNQAEFTLNFWRYLNSRVSDKRLQKGQKKLQKHQDLLAKIQQKYGVNPAILMAFWGLESNYGRNVGKMNLVRSLATLSFDLRRRNFFTKELLILLKLIDDGKLPADVQGSWAGAMGAAQFMPSNVAAYAVDSDSDGELDLWNSLADIMHSSANFLVHIGWHAGEKWGQEVALKPDFDFSLANLRTKKSVNEWQILGVRQADNTNLPSSEAPAALILPMGFEGPAFLVYHNFRTILRWNRSILYALAVGHLADKFSNNQALFAKPIVQKSLSRDDVLEMQIQLNKLGFSAGKPDGISGPKTRAAARKYQAKNSLPVDGYVGYQLLQQLQNER
ncbi:MAG: lytic murein transglycosylase [Candidatus Thioglobus sp.]|nr:lytic murein transglycosylase [Candidatus Thioglobus sp.]